MLMLENFLTDEQDASAKGCGSQNILKWLLAGRVCSLSLYFSLFSPFLCNFLTVSFSLSLKRTHSLSFIVSLLFLFLCLFLSMSLSVCSLCLSLYLSPACLSFCHYVCVSICPLSLSLHVSLSISVYHCLRLSLHRSLCLSVFIMYRMHSMTESKVILIIVRQFFNMEISSMTITLRYMVVERKTKVVWLILDE